MTENTNPSQGSRRAASAISSGGIVCDVSADDAEPPWTRTCATSAGRSTMVRTLATLHSAHPR